MLAGGFLQALLRLLPCQSLLLLLWFNVCLLSEEDGKEVVFKDLRKFRMDAVQRSQIREERVHEIFINCLRGNWGKKNEEDGEYSVQYGAYPGIPYIRI